MLRPVFVTFIFVSVFTTANAQQDTAKYKSVDRSHAVRVGYNYQRASSFEAGYCYWVIYNEKWFAANELYIAGEYFLSHEEGTHNYTGVKAGFATSNILLWGVEFRLLGNGDNMDFIFTPKVGVSLAGFFSFMYAYNVRDSGYHLKGISKNQFALTFNIAGILPEIKSRR